jgi:AhpD family alkylhydroperoxidase
MSKDYKAYAGDVDARAVNLFKAAPDTMRAYRGLMEAASKDGALDAKTKELMALAIGIALRCEGCIVFHVRAALRHGATREEVAESIGVAVELGGGPSAVYGADALAAFDQFAG